MALPLSKIYENGNSTGVYTDGVPMTNLTVDGISDAVDSSAVSCEYIYSLR
jgi:hypothetical protein